MDAAAATFQVLQAHISSNLDFALVLSADCIEGSCSCELVILNNFIIFNFPFVKFKQ